MATLATTAEKTEKKPGADEKPERKPQRARVDEFLHAVSALAPPPCLTAELTVAGESAGLKLRGCGLLVLNPPWGFAAVAVTRIT